VRETESKLNSKGGDDGGEDYNRKVKRFEKRGCKEVRAVMETDTGE